MHLDFDKAAAKSLKSPQAGAGERAGQEGRTIRYIRDSEQKKPLRVLISEWNNLEILRAYIRQ